MEAATASVLTDLVLCPRTLGPLHCVAGEAGHDYGCVFVSTSGVPDRHSATSGE